jgi:serine/threonine protein kinase
MTDDNQHEQGVPAEFINAVFQEDAVIDLGFERYVLKSLIGSGGLGVVVKAAKRSGELVALKFLYNQQKDTAADSYERFKQEVKATKRVGDISDACVKVYECGEYSLPALGWHVPFFAMEYVPGLSLEDFILIKETPFTPLEIYVVARQIAAALEEIHSKGIVHRDIKPPNILFHESRKILKVTDFGISRDTAARTDVTMPMADGRPVILGTLNYLSRYYFDSVPVPREQVREKDAGRFVREPGGEPVFLDNDGGFYCAYKGNRLDLSVLASVILFELTTCVNPYTGCTFPAILTDIMSGTRLDLRGFYHAHPQRFHPQIHERPSFLAHLDAIIRKGSVPDRYQSYATAAEVIADLDKAIKSSWGSVPDARQADEIMAILLGKTLVDEYEHVMRRMERAIRGDTFADDRDNITRMALLYKLKKTDRLMACLHLLHGRTTRLLKDPQPTRKETVFFHSLWERLERLGVEAEYRENSRRLKAVLATMERGG